MEYDFLLDMFSPGLSNSASGGPYCSSAEFSFNPNKTHLIQLIKFFRITRNFQGGVLELDSDFYVVYKLPQKLFVSLLNDANHNYRRGISLDEKDLSARQNVFYRALNNSLRQHIVVKHLAWLSYNKLMND